MTQLLSDPSFGLALQVVGAFLATVLLFVALWLVSVGIRWVERTVDARLEARQTDVHLQRAVILTSERLRWLLGRVLEGFRVVAFLALVYGYLGSVLSMFTVTRSFATSLLDQVGSILGGMALGVIGYLPNLLFIIVAVVVLIYAIRFVGFVAAEVEKGTIRLPGFYREWAEPTGKLVSAGVLVLGLVVIFPYLPGSGSSAFQSVSIFVGVLLSLGSSSAVANLIAGSVLIYTRAFNLGDRVQIADTTGDVVERSLLMTRIRTIKNVEITIPNALVLQSHIVNYSSVSHSQSLILHTTVTLGYDIPHQRVEAAFLAAAAATEGVLTEPRPFVFQTELNDFNVSYELNVYTDRPNDMANTTSELHRRLQDACAAAGIEILSPNYQSLRDGNASTIPSETAPAVPGKPGST